MTGDSWVGTFVGVVEDEGFGLGGFFGDDFGYVDSAGLFGVDGGRYG